MSQIKTETLSTISKYKRESQWSSVWRRLRKNKRAMLGLLIFLVLVFVAIFADLICDYRTQAIAQKMDARYQWPGPSHLFGTDQYGRDLFARVIFGARISLGIGVGAVVIAAVFGILLGATSGYFGGAADTIIMRFMDILLAIPSMILAIALIAAFGIGISNMLIAMSISSIPKFARIVRSSVMSVARAEYVESAIACGTHDIRIIFKHILPNVIGPIIVQTTFNLANVILNISGLSYIGLGVPSPQPEWGTILSENKSQMLYYPYLVIIPGCAILLTVLAINMLGDGLRDALDPRMKN